MDKYFVASIAGANSLGNKRVKKLVEVFGSGRAAWSADVADLKNCLPPKALEYFLEWRQNHPDVPEKLADYCERKGVGLCTFFDEDYPPLLKEISMPPVLFYYQGKILPNAERIAIVGTRDNTTYGKGIAIAFARELAAAGVTVVSGAARGIDTFAHTGALETGRTVAVLGQGLGFRFSREKKKLLDEIAERGLVMSEFSLGTPPNEGTFVTRNRIIAGLCRGIVIVEAGERSGALNTGTWALDNSRDVFAVPGSLHWEKSSGCHELLHEGSAFLIRNAQDVLDHYSWDVPKKIPVPIAEVDEVYDSPVPKKISAPPVKADKVCNPPVKRAELSAEAAKIFELIPSDGSITDDEILDALDDIATNELAKFTLELEVKGYIVEDAGRYTRK